MPCWTETKNGIFSLEAMYKVLEARPSFSCPLANIWSVLVQPKLCFFAWEATWGKILTLDQLQRRGFALANRCFLCQEVEETANHLLLPYAVTRVLWDLLFFIWHLLGEPSLGVGYAYGVEGIFCKKGLEDSMESGTFVYLLDSLEG